MKNEENVRSFQDMKYYKGKITLWSRNGNYLPNSCSFFSLSNRIPVLFKYWLTLFFRAIL